MNWKKIMSDQSGMTLIEALAAGMILLIAALMASKGFLFAGAMMERSAEMQSYVNDAKLAAEIGEQPANAEECQLVIGEGTLTVIVEEYGPPHPDSYPMFKTIRTAD